MSNLIVFCWRCGKKADSKEQKFCITDGLLNDYAINILINVFDSRVILI
jgi:hypothetical protein